MVLRSAHGRHRAGPPVVPDPAAGGPRPRGRGVVEMLGATLLINSADENCSGPRRAHPADHRSWRAVCARDDGCTRGVRPFDAINQAFDDSAGGATLKPVLVF